jgi:hypothetical protein
LTDANKVDPEKVNAVCDEEKCVLVPKEDTDPNFCRADGICYSCDISAAVSALTGWQGLVSFHQPDLDPRGVCEEGCVEDSWAAHPLCAVAVDDD